MPGMGGGLQANNPTMEAAFRSALHHQAIAVILVALLLAAAYAVTRTITAHRLVSAGDVGGGRPAAATGAAAGADDPVGVAEPPEPAARRILRITFGCLWIFDGLLQLQAQMPIGLATQVVSPTADAQPHWLATVIQWGVLVWQNHPVEAAVATVWIQVGIGAWMLVAPRGRWSRLGGLASVSWAIVVWVMGEGLGQILTPSGTWLFGAPGAVVFYAVAGALDSAARVGVARPCYRSPNPPRHGRGVPGGGSITGASGARLLGRDRAVQHGASDVVASPTPPAGELGQRLRQLCRKQRPGGQYLRDRRPRRRRARSRDADLRTRELRRRRRALRGDVGIRAGLRLPRRGRHRSEQRHTDDPPPLHRLPGAARTTGHGDRDRTDAGSGRRGAGLRPAPARAERSDSRWSAG